MKLSGSGSESYPLGGFYISGVGHSASTVRGLHNFTIGSYGHCNPSKKLGK